MRSAPVLAKLLALLLAIAPARAQMTPPAYELKADVEQLWNSVAQKRGPYRGGAAPELIIVPGPGTLDAALKANSLGRPVVNIGQELIISLLRIGQANVYVFVHTSADVEKKTALGSYMQEIARGIARAEREGSSFQPIAISEFFHMSDAESSRLAVDEDFKREVRRQFRSMMIFMLAHEYAHFALGHHASRAASGSDDELAQEIEADELAHRLVREVDETLVMGATLPMVFYLAYLYESGRPARQLRELCKRAIDNAVEDVNFVRERVRRQPGIIEEMLRMGIDPRAYEQAGQEFRQYRAICEGYGRL